jgi:hypothetical protein
LAIAMGFLSNAGCCRMWERWCHGPNNYQPPAYCVPACPPACPPNPCFSSPGGIAVPVPNAPGNTTWQRCP